MNTPDTPKISLRSETDLLAAIPFLIGWHPVDSLIVLALNGKRLVFTARVDLPPVGPMPAAAVDAINQLAYRTAKDSSSAILVGYGEPDRVEPVLDRALTAMQLRSVPVPQALRLTGDRFFCHLCAECMPDGGVPYNPDASTAPAAATREGMVALADRDALVQKIAPIQGRDRRWMQDATRSALIRLRASVAAFDAAGLPLSPHALAKQSQPIVARLGRKAVDEAFAAANAGKLLTDGQAAWLSVLLAVLAVRDYAWQRTDAGDIHARLWTDLTSRAQGTLAAGPACLLAYNALLRGDGGLANIALQRAAEADPGYSIARLLLDAMDSGLSPRAIRDAIALSVDDDLDDTDQPGPDADGRAAPGSGSPS